jgi:hypothetical protein
MMYFVVFPGTRRRNTMQIYMMVCVWWVKKDLIGGLPPLIIHHIHTGRSLIFIKSMGDVVSSPITESDQERINEIIGDFLKEFTTVFPVTYKVDMRAIDNFVYLMHHSGCCHRKC